MKGYQLPWQKALATANAQRQQARGSNLNSQSVSSDGAVGDLLMPFNRIPDIRAIRDREKKASRIVISAEYFVLLRMEDELMRRW